MTGSGDYISREAAYQFFKDQFEEETGAFSKGRNAGLRVAMSAVMNNDAIPAADVRPVVRAHWTDRRTIEHDGEWYCSACGNEVTICMCGKDKTRDYPFCPNCGADMRGESDV